MERVGFIKKIPEPPLKYDIDPQCEGVIHRSSNDTGLPSEVLDNCIFDPPFLTYVRKGREGNGKMIMSNQFSGYWRYDELEDRYITTIKESHRILKYKGILVFKCQDIIHNHRMHCTHFNIIKWADGMFRLKDLFILPAKSRLPSPNRDGKQKHARIFHSYFLVLERLK